MFKNLSYSKQKFIQYVSDKCKLNNYFNLSKTDIFTIHSKAREYFENGFTISTIGKFPYSDKILTFSSTGFEDNSTHLPLIVSKSKYAKASKDKKRLASFIGNLQTHAGIRGALKYIESDSIFVSFNEFPESEYYQTMSESKFALCPRGVELNSYRICEALYCGVVPVYVSDKFVELPNLEKYCIKVHSSKISDIPNLLNSVSDAKYLLYVLEGKKALKKYYTYPLLLKWILDYLK